MKFQPGQSGNPAGRPSGARNKKTIAMEDVFRVTATETAKLIVARAQCGNATAMRLVMERTPPELELPKVECADDVQKALNTVTDAFSRGALTVRELSSLLGSVERMARVTERIQQNRESEHERYAKQRVHGVHPSMIPKPTGEPDPLEPILAAIERGEDPFPDDPVKSAYVLTGERVYSPVNSDGEAAASPPDTAAQGAEASASVADGLYFSVNSVGESLPRAAGEGGSPERSEGEPGGGAAHEPEKEILYSPVNLDDEFAGASPPPGAADAAPPSPCGGGMQRPLYLNPG